MNMPAKNSFLLSVVYFGTFYSLLCLFSVGYFRLLFYFQIPPTRPKLTGRQSLLGFNPGLSVLPQPDISTSLIHIRGRDPLSRVWNVDHLVAFTWSYLPSKNSAAEDCRDAPFNRDISKHCYYDLDSAGPCNVAANFYLDSSSPCMILRMNTVFGWVPDLVEFATGVLVKCEGATPEDTRALGNILYYDMDYKILRRPFERGKPKTSNGSFAAMFFPNMAQRGHLSPLVLVMFKNIQKHYLIRVQCYLIAKNIDVNFQRGDGSVRFEILVD